MDTDLYRFCEKLIVQRKRIWSFFKNVEVDREFRYTGVIGDVQTDGYDKEKDYGLIK